jgi:hypothetical protein
MRHAAEYTSVQSDSRTDGYSSIISNLGSLVEQVHVNINLIEAAIASETALDESEAGASIVVLDDVTPRYLRANAALNASKIGLGLALHLLEEIGSLRRRMTAVEDQPVGRLV